MVWCYMIDLALNLAMVGVGGLAIQSHKLVWYEWFNRATLMCILLKFILSHTNM